MSPERLRITAGRKTAATCAALATIALALVGCLVSMLVVMPLLSGQPEELSTIGTVASSVGAVAVAGTGLGLMRLALGRHRTGGSLARYGRYLLASFGIGTAVGLGMAAVLLGSGPLTAEPVGRIAALCAGVLLLGLSLLLFRPARHRPVAHTPHPWVTLATGTVVEHWWVSAGHVTVPQLSVVEYLDEHRRPYYALHLYQQRLTALGVVGQLHLDRRRPGRVLRFSVENRARFPRPGR